jgi:hypothetical protein
MGLLIAEQPASLYAVERLISTDVTAQVMQVHHIPIHPRYEEEGEFRGLRIAI